MEEAVSSGLPDDLTELRQWVLYRIEERDGKPSKVPYHTDRYPADTTDPRTWSSFGAVSLFYRHNRRKRTSGYDGIGFVFTERDPYCGIDIDHCLDDAGAVKPWAQSILETFSDTYMEISPSGRGIKIFCKARLSGSGKKAPLGDGAVEIYDRGRYFTVTGQRWRDVPLEVEDHQRDVEELYRQISGDSPARPKANLHTEPKIEAGHRHDFLLSVAAQFRARGMTRTEVLAAIHAVNQERCDPPKAADELEKIVDWLESKEATSIDGAVVWLKNLKPDSPVPDQQTGLRNFARCLAGAALVDRVVLREQAVRLLKDAGFTAPAMMIDGALAPVNSPKQEASSGTSLESEDIEPWPEPVGGADLLKEIFWILQQYVILPDHATTAIALWVTHTAAYDAFNCSPYLAITSPVKRCGKTRLMSVLTALVPNAMPASNITPAAVFRTIEACRPALLIDEADTFLRDNEELRGVLNSGHTRTMAYVVRLVGDEHRPTKFSTWCPKAVAMIGRPPQTIEDRSIVIEMGRKASGEKVTRFHRGSKAELLPIRQRIVRWAADNHESLEKASPDVPMLGSDRAIDNWEPLLAIADLAGGRWPELARVAAQQLTNPTATAETSVLLLTDIKEMFESQATDRLSSEQIIVALGGMEERPWSEYRNGHAITKNQLARALRSFGIRPQTLRLSDGRLAKGYASESFLDAFRRYTPSQTVTSVTKMKTKGLDDFQNVTEPSLVTFQNDDKSNEINEVTAVTVQKGVLAGIGGSNGKENLL